MKQEYIGKIYAGWLAKMIGIRLGAPVEGWTSERIEKIHGGKEGYLCEYQNFAADDDSNGPAFLVRALEEGGHFPDLQPADVAEALLNYAPWEHGFFWFGGYGVSTEHTAFLNLWNGIPAPVSGSGVQNGWAVAEQIGGQIFIDCWGLISPGNPERAARFARAAASVTHDGDGIWGGVFIAVCISQAFVEKDIRRIIRKGLEYIPADSGYGTVVRAVMGFYDTAPEDWRRCLAYVQADWGYDRYPGNCHIIPNAAVIILALLYGEGDFDKTLQICNRCGWDTDCNVGNVAAIMGVRGGTEEIDYEKWRKDMNDLAIFSTTAGAYNISDIPEGASYMARLAYALDGEEPPAAWKEIWGKKRGYCHFRYPGSTHAFRIRSEGEGKLKNIAYDPAEGTRCLLARIDGAGKEAWNEVYRKTYYEPSDFSDSRYDPAFSPTLYPGQTVRFRITVPKEDGECEVCQYVKVRGKDGEELLCSKAVRVLPGEDRELAWRIPTAGDRAPACGDTPVREDAPARRDTSARGDTPAGGDPLARGDISACADAPACGESTADGTILETGLRCLFPQGSGRLLIRSMEAEGDADYRIRFESERTEKWNDLHREISQFTRQKGLTYLEDGWLHLTGTDFAECYTGDWEWTDYWSEYELTPLSGREHYVLFRVQGARRCYGIGFTGPDRLGLWKKEGDVRLLHEIPFAWEYGKTYRLKVRAAGNGFRVYEGDRELFDRKDQDTPYLSGGVGLGVRNNSHCKYRQIGVWPVVHHK